MRYLSRTTVALAVLIATVSFISTALAVQPKKGVDLYGGTSMPGQDDYMFMQISASGKTFSISVPVIEGFIVPRMKNVKVTKTGTFSATREVTSKAGTEWVLKIKGKFTAPTKAKGSFSAKGVSHRGGRETKISSGGKQTFSLKFLK